MFHPAPDLTRPFQTPPRGAPRTQPPSAARPAPTTRAATCGCGAVTPAAAATGCGSTRSAGSRSRKTSTRSTSRVSGGQVRGVRGGRGWCSRATARHGAAAAPAGPTLPARTTPRFRCTAKPAPSDVKWVSGARFSREDAVRRLAADFERRLRLRANESLPLVYLDVGIRGKFVGRCGRGEGGRIGAGPAGRTVRFASCSPAGLRPPRGPPRLQFAWHGELPEAAWGLHKPQPIGTMDRPLDPPHPNNKGSRSCCSRTPRPAPLRTSGSSARVREGDCFDCALVWRTPTMVLATPAPAYGAAHPAPPHPTPPSPTQPCRRARHRARGPRGRGAALPFQGAAPAGF
jgi:hypothetical protein